MSDFDEFVKTLSTTPTENFSDNCFGSSGSMSLEDKLTRVDISKYERAIREPSLLTLLEYSGAINISTNVLIDDNLDLP
jgi:hypothetical protein